MLQENILRTLSENLKQFKQRLAEMDGIRAELLQYCGIILNLKNKLKPKTHKEMVNNIT